MFFVINFNQITNQRQFRNLIYRYLINKFILQHWSAPFCKMATVRLMETTDNKGVIKDPHDGSC